MGLSDTIRSWFARERAEEIEEAEELRRDPGLAHELQDRENMRGEQGMGPSGGGYLPPSKPGEFE
jgi:hypothetical protein